MERLGWDIWEYFSSEIDPYAIKITTKNYPDIIHVGSVTGLKYEEGALFHNQDNDPMKNGGSYIVDIDILIGWSPCQDLSAAKANGKGLDGEKSSLFFEYARILQEVKPKYFLLENVASMKKVDRDIITGIMGVEPTLINSALVSAQNRKRLYWAGVRNEDGTYSKLDIPQPEDRNIFLRDILEDIPMDDPSWKPLDDKYVQKLKENKNCFYETNSIWKLRQGYEMFKVDWKTYWLTVWHTGNTRIIKKKAYALTATYPWACPRDYIEKSSREIVMGMALRNRWEWKAPEFNGQEKANSLTTVQTDSLIADPNTYFWRKLTPIECERLQTLPDNYTNHVSATRRYKAIGNGWTVDVIAHILSFCNF